MLSKKIHYTHLPWLFINRHAMIKLNVWYPLLQWKNFNYIIKGWIFVIACITMGNFSTLSVHTTTSPPHDFASRPLILLSQSGQANLLCIALFQLQHRHRRDKQVCVWLIGHHVCPSCLSVTDRKTQKPGRHSNQSDVGVLGLRRYEAVVVVVVVGRPLLAGARPAEGAQGH